MSTTNNNKQDGIQAACEQFKLMMEKLGYTNVVVVYGYTTKDDEVRSGYASDGVIYRIGLLTYLLTHEKNRISYQLKDDEE